MVDCPCLAGCPFFNDHMHGFETIKDMLKKRLCKGDNTDCARFMVFKELGKAAVPSDLFPDQIDKAREILNEQKEH